MAGVQFIEYRGIEILYIDFSYSTSHEEILDIMQETKRLIATRPPASVLTLTNITEAFFDREISQALKDLAAYNKPYVKAGAVIGLTAVRRIIYNAVMFFSKRHLEIFDDLESAKEWLLNVSKKVPGENT